MWFRNELASLAEVSLYSLVSLRSAGSCVRLLPRLPMTSILLSLPQERVLGCSSYARCDEVCRGFPIPVQVNISVAWNRQRLISEFVSTDYIRAYFTFNNIQRKQRVVGWPKNQSQCRVVLPDGLSPVKVTDQSDCTFSVVCISGYRIKFIRFSRLNQSCLNMVYCFSCFGIMQVWNLCEFVRRVLYSTNTQNTLGFLILAAVFGDRSPYHSSTCTF
jgi:hypothetical protein